jgi:hypothetical protein
VRELGGRIVVACGDAGLWTLERDASGGLRLVATEDLGGEVVGLFEREGHIWVEIERLEARPLRPTAGSPSPPPPSARAEFEDEDYVPPARREPRAKSDTHEEPASRAPVGEVVEVNLGEAVVNLGSDDHVRPGQLMELVELHTDTIGKERAVGVVTAVAEQYCRVRLGTNERVSVGASAQIVAGRASSSRIAPPRAAGIWEVEFMLRPFLAMSDFGGGFLSDALVGYHFDTPLHLRAGLTPLAYGTGKDKASVATVAAFGEVSYDGDLFEAGLGLGAQTVNSVTGADSGSGTLFLQHARLGARDGLHFDARSDIVLFHSRFEFSGFRATGQLPVGRSSWLLLQGGGGTAGYGYGELGVRVLLRGNGDRGSVFFTGSVGGVGVFADRVTTCGDPAFQSFDCTESTLYAGPMLGAGAEWRF